MNTYSIRRAWVGLAVLIGASCSPPTPPGPARPYEYTPLPPGTYQLSAHAKYHADTRQGERYSYVTYGTRLYVSMEGGVRLYDGDQQCTDVVDLPNPQGHWMPPAGHSFECGDRGWHLWERDGKVVGRMSTQVTAMRRRNECLRWNFDTGHQVCAKYGWTVKGYLVGLTADVNAQKVGS